MSYHARTAAERDRRAAEVLVAVFASPEGDAPGPDPASWRIAGRPLTPRQLADVLYSTEAAWERLRAVHDAEGTVLAEQVHIVAERLDAEADVAWDDGRRRDARHLRDSAVRLRAVAVLAAVGAPL